MKHQCPQCGKTVELTDDELAKQAGAIVCPKCLCEFTAQGDVLGAGSADQPPAYCEKCGSLLHVKANYCHHCGKAVKPMQRQTAPAVGIRQSTATVTHTEPTHTHQRPIHMPSYIDEHNHRKPAKVKHPIVAYIVIVLLVVLLYLLIRYIH